MDFASSGLCRVPSDEVRGGVGKPVPKRRTARIAVVCRRAGRITLGYRRPTRLVLFVAGTVVSQLALTGFGFWPADWKFGYAYPATAAVLVLVSSRKHVLSFAVLTCLALAHLLMDFRIFGAICIVAAILTYVK